MNNYQIHDHGNGHIVCHIHEKGGEITDVLPVKVKRYAHGKPYAYYVRVNGCWNSTGPIDGLEPPVIDDEYIKSLNEVPDYARPLIGFNYPCDSLFIKKKNKELEQLDFPIKESVLSEVCDFYMNGTVNVQGENVNE